MTGRRIRSLAGATAVAALVLTGCAEQPAASSSARTEPIGSLAALIERVGAATAAKQGAHVSITSGDAGAGLKGAGDVRFGAEPVMDLTISTPGAGDVGARFVDGVLYLRPPSTPEPGKPWVRIDPAGADQVSQQFGSLGQQMRRAGDPSLTLNQLEGAGEITGTKRERLGGKDTTRYTVTVDIGKMLAKQTDEDLRKLLEQAAAAGGAKSFPVDVWLDEENLPARITLDIPVAGQTGQPARLKLTTDYSDWGKRVDVTAPAAAEIAQPPR